MIAALVAGLLAGYGVAVPVGAVAAYLIALTARTSLTTGACAALGVATADGLYALVATVGGSAVAAVIRPVLVPLRWCSAIVLIVLAVRGLAGVVARYRERLTATRPEPLIGPGRAYLGLLGITLLNPTTVIYFVALVLGGQSTVAADQPRRAVFVLAAFAASASWQLLLVCGGALLGRALTGARGRLVTALVSSLVMTVLALDLLIA